MDTLKSILSIDILDHSHQLDYKKIHKLQLLPYCGKDRINEIAKWNLSDDNRCNKLAITKYLNKFLIYRNEFDSLNRLSNNISKNTKKDITHSKTINI